MPNSFNLYEIDDCIICLRPLCSNLVVMKCGHVLHQGCLDSFLKQEGAACPICKEPIKRKQHQRLLFRLEQVKMSTQIKITNDSAVAMFNAASLKLQTKERSIEHLNGKVSELTRRINQKEYDIGVYRQAVCKKNMTVFYKEEKEVEKLRFDSKKAQSD